jgi:hypothetical protein
MHLVISEMEQMDDGMPIDDDHSRAFPLLRNFNICSSREDLHDFQIIRVTSSRSMLHCRCGGEPLTLEQSLSELATSITTFGED